MIREHLKNDQFIYFNKKMINGIKEIPNEAAWKYEYQ